MLGKIRIYIVLLLLLLAATTSIIIAQGEGNTIAVVVANDARFSSLNEAMKTADLTEMYSGPGPYTLFAPTNEAMAALGEEGLSNSGSMRQTILYHTMTGAVDSKGLWGMKTANTALGKSIAISHDGALVLNATSTVKQFDIQAANGVIHVLDVALNPHGAAAGEEGAAAPEVPAGPPEPVNTVLGSPQENPAFVSGGHVPYWTGVLVPSNSCKGMTFLVLEQANGVTRVGADRQTNPYRGDTGCGTELPVLCINQNFASPPEPRFARDWAAGNVRVSKDVRGTELTSKDAANAVCTADFGPGWRMAEFHDGNVGVAAGSHSGWTFSALGGLPIGERFWVHISDQPANPWNSQVARTGPPSVSGAGVHEVGADGAFVQGGRVMPWQGQQAGRAVCKGTSWVIHKQGNGLVKVGADAKTNPYTGDTSCSVEQPALCIKVDGYGPPANEYGNNYSEGWSGGQVRLTHNVSGFYINSREAANNVCLAAFGHGWRFATHHDGSLGTGGTDGWALWAYGGIATGNRFWIGVNDQMSNPWNATK